MVKKATKLAPLHVVETAPKKLYLDIGCGKTKPETVIASDSVLFAGLTPDNWEGIDAIDFGQKHVFDVTKIRPEALKEQELFRAGALSGQPVYEWSVKWPFTDNSVDGVHSSHFVEHLTGAERIGFFNELYRVMKVGAIAKITTPHWSNACAYGDPTHQWPPMSEWFAYYLNKGWRDTQAPHVGYTCDFDFIISGSWDGRLVGRNPEFVQQSMATQINAWRDLIVILTKRSPT